jgi:hypothetical protein
VADEDGKRAANEAAFREANERIRTARDELDPPVERVPFLCECDDVRCRRTIPLTRQEYEAVRSDGALFVVAPGHNGGAEIVDEEKERYVTVRKHGDAGEVARALDPREEVS